MREETGPDKRRRIPESSRGELQIKHAVLGKLEKQGTRSLWGEECRLRGKHEAWLNFLFFLMVLQPVQSSFFYPTQPTNSLHPQKTEEEEPNRLDCSSPGTEEGGWGAFSQNACKGVTLSQDTGGTPLEKLTGLWEKTNGFVRVKLTFCLILAVKWPNPYMKAPS